MEPESRQWSFSFNRSFERTKRFSADLTPVDICAVHLLMRRGSLGQYSPYLCGKPVWTERLCNIRYPGIEHTPASNDLRCVARCEQHLQLWPQNLQMFTQRLTIDSGQHHVCQQEMTF